MKCYTTTQQVTQHNEDKQMTEQNTTEQKNQINTVLAEIEDVDSLNTKYQLEIYKVFYTDVKRIMRGISK